MKVGVSMIVRDEQELLPWCFEGLMSIRDFIEVVAIVDNGSIDATPYIIEKHKDRLPITVTFEAQHHHHGNLRNLALEPCRGRCDWILYIDSDETFTLSMANWLASGEMGEADIWDFMKYSTITDHLHHVPSGAGPTTRFFRNVPGVHYTQPVHTEPIGDGLKNKQMCKGVYYFEHTGLKTLRSLWAKGWRYQEHMGEAGIGSPREYVTRVEGAYNRMEIEELPEEVRRAGIVSPPSLDAHLYEMLSRTVLPTLHPSGPCWLKGG